MKLASNEWANEPSTNCSFFDANASACSEYTWLDETPLVRCCSCGGGVVVLGPSPPAPPLAPVPPSPPCYDKSGVPTSWHLVRNEGDGAHAWAVGNRRCDFFSSFESATLANDFSPGADPCLLYKW